MILNIFCGLSAGLSLVARSRPGTVHNQVPRAASERHGPDAANFGRLQDSRYQRRQQEPAEAQDQGAEVAGGKGAQAGGKGPQGKGEDAEEGRKERGEGEQEKIGIVACTVSTYIVRYKSCHIIVSRFYVFLCFSATRVVSRFM